MGRKIVRRREIFRLSNLRIWGMNMYSVEFLLLLLLPLLFLLF
jgi:hypothetical protein